GTGATPRLSREPRARTSGISRIVVVDNGSRDGSAAAIRARFPAVTALPLPKNRGYAGGNNASCGSPSSTAPRRFSCDVAGPREALSARAARARDPRQADGPWSPRSRGTITRSDGAVRGLERAPSSGSSDRLVRCDRPHVHATWYVETYVQTATRLVVRGKADVGVAPFVARLERCGTEEHRRFPRGIIPDLHFAAPANGANMRYMKVRNSRCATPEGVRSLASARSTENPQPATRSRSSRSVYSRLCREPPSGVPR